MSNKDKDIQSTLERRLENQKQGFILSDFSGFAVQPEPESKKEKQERNDGFCGFHVVLFASVYKKIQIYSLQTNRKVKDIIKEIVTDIPEDKEVLVYLYSPYIPEPTEEDLHTDRRKKNDDSKVFQITIDLASLNKLKKIKETCKFYTPEGTLIEGQMKHLLNSAMIHFLDQHK